MSLAMGRVGIALALALGAFSLEAQAQVRITEFMYDGASGGVGLGEFVELTNLGASSVDMTGWTFDDSGDTAGSVSIGAFGVVAAGESVVIAQATSAAAFRTAWSLAGTVKVVSYTTGQLNRNDSIIIKDSGNNVVTQLLYGDQTYSGTVRAQNKSAWPCAEVVGQSPITTSWILSAALDSVGSHTNTATDVGSPGLYVSHSCQGACCTQGLCSGPVPPTSCTGGGGVYQGDGSSCGSVNCPVPSTGVMRITEYMYSGTGGEYIEFTNLDNHPIDMTGWSFDDNSRVAGSQSLSAFGTVASGQSVILTESTAAAFAAAWGLSGVVIIGGNTNNLGRDDEINLYDSGGGLVDRLTYGDDVFAPGTIRANGASGWPCNTAVGANTIADWFLSYTGDVQNSYASANGDIGNPGTFISHACVFCGNHRVDAGEQCDGGTCCATDCTFIAAGTECRAAVDVCDAAESCTGVSSACPTDGFQPAGTECRPAAGTCDVAELCAGTGATCPPDGFQPQGTLCRGAVDVCDAAESCDGTSAFCPADGVQPSGTPCRASTGICDVAENCDGTNTSCPPDAFDTGTGCRASTGACDPAENCDGTGPNCPADAAITQCANGDGCCPQSCNANTDDDCQPFCGNQVVEQGEECDGSQAANCASGVCQSDCTCQAVAPVPTVSEWGLILLTLVGTTVGVVLFTRRNRVTTG